MNNWLLAAKWYHKVQLTNTYMYMYIVHSYNALLIVKGVMGGVGEELIGPMKVIVSFAY